MTMTIPEALKAAQESPLLSKFEPSQLGQLVTTLKMLAYAASHPASQGTEPPLQAIQDFMDINPDLVQVFTKVAHCILQDLSNMDYPEVPSHELFANTFYVSLGALLSIAATGELHPSTDQIESTMEGQFCSTLMDRALTILWTIFYPGQPLMNGEVHTIESFAAACKAGFEA